MIFSWAASRSTSPNRSRAGITSWGKGFRRGRWSTPEPRRRRWFAWRRLAGVLVGGVRSVPRWRLTDLWNNMYLLGNLCLGMAHETIRPAPQPAFHEAALVLGAVCLLCLTHLMLRIRAVEIVR